MDRRQSALCTGSDCAWPCQHRQFRRRHGCAGGLRADCAGFPKLQQADFRIPLLRHRCDGCVEPPLSGSTAGMALVYADGGGGCPVLPALFRDRAWPGAGTGDAVPEPAGDLDAGAVHSPVLPSLFRKGRPAHAMARRLRAVDVSVPPLLRLHLRSGDDARGMARLGGVCGADGVGGGLCHCDPRIAGAQVCDHPPAVQRQDRHRRGAQSPEPVCGVCPCGQTRQGSAGRAGNRAAGFHGRKEGAGSLAVRAFS